MKKIWNKHHEKIITLLLFGVLFLGVVAVIALVSGTIMSFLGFKYKSVGSIVLFFLMATVISYPISLIAEALPKVLLYLKKIQKNSAILLYIVLDTIATFLGLVVVDYCMESVSATRISVIVIALILSLTGIRDIDKRPKGVEEHGNT